MTLLKFILFALLWTLKSVRSLTAAKSAKVFIFTNVKSAMISRLCLFGANQGFVIAAATNIKNSEPKRSKANLLTVTTGI